MHFAPQVRKRMVELSATQKMEVWEIARVFAASESGVRRVLQRLWHDRMSPKVVERLIRRARNLYDAGRRFGAVARYVTRRFLKVAF